MAKIKMVAIPEVTFRKVAGILNQLPYGEVAGLMSELEQTTVKGVEIDTPEAGPNPVQEVKKTETPKKKK